MARRGENIYKRKDGRYEGRYIRGRRIDGKPLFGYIYAYSYKDVKKALTAAKASLGDSASVKTIGKGSTKEFLNYWMENIVKQNVKTSTFAQYHDRVHKHIVPALGELPIRKLSSEKVQKFIAVLEDKGLCPSTVRNIYGTLFSAMKKAVQLSLLDANPCEGVRLPEKEKKVGRALEQTEQVKLENKAYEASKDVQLSVFLALYSGLRIGEICALKWEDINLRQGSITVRKTLQRVRNTEDVSSKTSLLEGSPKSAKSCRTIPMPKGLTAMIRELCSAREGYVLSGTETPIEPRTVRKKFKRLAKKAELGDITFHSLRHTYATRCFENNFDIQTVSELLGHSNAGVTMNVYAHSVMEHKRLLTQRMQILSGFKPSNEPSRSLDAC